MDEQARLELARDWLTRGSRDLAGEFNQHLQAAAVLTPYASAFRYPGGAFEPMPSREEFDEALDLTVRPRSAEEDRVANSLLPVVNAPAGGEDIGVFEWSAARAR